MKKVMLVLGLFILAGQASAIKAMFWCSVHQKYEPVAEMGKGHRIGKDPH